ncbi:zinc finger Ran-binding domain-containing protein 2-like [Dorcoceras hygrometricum]|nr:zinc finger Ran-binding domain-containing protein 2-like [Dorcoceras hygrometricum]
MSREGDWMCGACQHLNFKKRDSCQRCTCPKYATESDVSSYAAALQKTEMLAGDWYCGAMSCGVHNYASRTSCFKCGALKDYYGYGAAVVASAGYGYDAIPGWKNGDWICPRFVHVPCVYKIHSFISNFSKKIVVFRSTLYYV